MNNIMNTTNETNDHINEKNHAIHYIIAQNNKLIEQNNEFNMKNKEFESSIEELEIDVDQLTKSKNLMQGYLKNFKEIDDIERKISKEYKQMYTKGVNIVNILIVFMCTFIGTTFNYVDAYSKSTIVVLFGTLTYIIYRVKKEDDNSAKYIALLNTEISNLKNSMDILIDLIDNL
jgi:hypothetical protein